jgi:hypothetical protein
MAAIGEQMAQPRQPVPDGAEDNRSAITVLDARRVDDGTYQKAELIGHDVTLAPLDERLAWLNRFRRRYERRADVHEPFVIFGCALICLNQMRWFCQAF